MSTKYRLLSGIILYLILATIFINFFYYKNWNQSIFNLGFCFGDVIESILKRNSFEGQFIENYPIIFKAHRLPAIPYFIAAISYISGSDKIFVIALIKNLLFTVLWFPIIKNGILDLKINKKIKFIFLIFLLSFPQFIIRTLQIELEEAYVAPLLAYFWILLIKKEPFNNFEIISFIILPSLLFFSRNIFLYIAPILLIIILITTKKNLKIILTSLTLLIFSTASLAYFNKINAGKFTLNYSLEWINIYKGFNEKTSELFPKYSLDILDYIDFYKIPESIKDEWAFNEFFKKKTIKFIKENPTEALKLLPSKFLTTWVDIRPNSIFFGEEKKLKSLEKIIGIFFMLIFRIIQWFCIFYALKKIFTKSKNEEKIFSLNFLLLISLYFAPYTIAYGSERHLMPIILPVIITYLRILEIKQNS